MASYRTLLFDLDHTLFDSDASQSAAYELTMRSIGVEDPAGAFAVFDRINQSLWRAVERHELSPNDVKELRFRRLLDELGRDGDPAAMGATFVHGLATEGQLYPGALELLDELAPVATLALVTNGIGSVQRGRIDRLGLDDYFDAVVISGEVGTNKPGTQIFDLTFDALEGADRSTSVMIGDNLGSDIQGGINAGIDTVWLNSGGRLSPGDVRPTHEVSSLGELRTVL